MKLLILGGNEVLQRSVAGACRAAAHQVRVVANGARASSSAASPAQVEPAVVNGSSPAAIADGARGCEAAIAIDRAVTPRAADVDLPLDMEQALDAVRAAGVGRLVLVCARDDEAGRSDAIEHAARRSFPEWLIVRSATVYGIGGDPLSLLLIMMRSLPAVPLLGASHRMQPIWHEDLARALAAAAALPAAAVNRAVEIAGPDIVTHDDLYARMSALIDRRPVRVPVPDFLAAHGARLAEALHLSVPFDVSRLSPGAAPPRDGAATGPALTTVFGVSPTALDEGLRRLIRDLEELTPPKGVGRVEVKRFQAMIRGSRHDAAGLLQLFRARFAEVMPIEVGVEPAAPEVELTPGSVLTMNLPGRGHVQVRVEEVEPHHVVISTLRGHALAGIVRFSATPLEDGLLFQVMTCDSAANAFDWVTLTLGGARIQDANWTKVLQNVVTLSGGHADAIRSDARTLSDEEAADAERLIEAIIARQRGSGDAPAGYERPTHARH